MGHKTLLAFAVLYTSIITWLSLAKVFIPINVKVEGSDKIGHLLAYFVFTIVWFAFFFYSKKQSRKFITSWTWAATFGFLFGNLMEFLQAILTSYRSPDWQDALANTSGIILAVFLLIILKNKLVRYKVKL
ncbi:VanZ family protein [Aquimarina litoralis]|uniref:VanZ family protein n=1 Tax=Aquimarina litoralis TaxID=584605 RepID=UPI001C56F253|nr:VanZ family protein [Aquimarina litoralis]